MSAGRYIDVSQTENSTHLQKKTTFYMQEVGIKIANCYQNFATCPFSRRRNAKTFCCL